jgi:hypothetical protein
MLLLHPCVRISSQIFTAKSFKIYISNFNHVTEFCKGSSRIFALGANFGVACESLKELGT